MNEPSNVCLYTGILFDSFWWHSTTDTYLSITLSQKKCSWTCFNIDKIRLPNVGGDCSDCLLQRQCSSLQKRDLNDADSTGRVKPPYRPQFVHSLQFLCFDIADCINSQQGWHSECTWSCKDRIALVSNLCIAIFYRCLNINIQERGSSSEWSQNAFCLSGATAANSPLTSTAFFSLVNLVDALLVFTQLLQLKPHTGTRSRRAHKPLTCCCTCDLDEYSKQL